MLNIVIITWYNQNFIEVHRLVDFYEVSALGELSYIKATTEFIPLIQLL